MKALSWNVWNWDVGGLFFFFLALSDLLKGKLTIMEIESHLCQNTDKRFLSVSPITAKQRKEPYLDPNPQMICRLDSVDSHLWFSK